MKSSKVIKYAGLIMMFLLLTSAVIPDIKLKNHKQIQLIPVELFDKQYFIQKKMSDIEIMKSEVIVMQKEISIMVEL